MWKAELIHRRVHWNAKKPLGLAKLERVLWFNHHQLREPIGYIISTKRKIAIASSPVRQPQWNNLNQLTTTKPKTIHDIRINLHQHSSMLVQSTNITQC
jgi:hypothetical protein